MKCISNFFYVLIGHAIIISAFFSCSHPIKKDTLFTCLPPSTTHIDFTNALTETVDRNIIQYLYFYNGAGVAIGDINNDDLPDIYFCSNQGQNKLYLNKGNFQFEDITRRAGVQGTGDWSSGVTMADVNGDGLLDIYVSQVGGYKWFKGKNLLYINQGNLKFLESAAAYSLDRMALSTQAVFFDYDNDGDLDMYSLCHSVHSSNNYGKSILRYQTDELSGDKLFKNVNGKFIDATKEAGIWSSSLGYGLGVAVGDVNNDGWADLYVGNDFHENDYLYINNGNGTFSDEMTKSMQHTSYFSMGNDLSDFNNDGRLDLITLDMKPEDEVVYKKSVGPDAYDIFEFKRSYGYYYQYPRNALQLNMGNLENNIPYFLEIGQLSGIDATDWSWSSLFADFDRDGWKDLYITNGIIKRPNDLDYLKFFSNPIVQKKATDLELIDKMPTGSTANYCFKNNGDFTFTNAASDWGLNQNGISTGAAYGDLDNDGDLDIVVNNTNDVAFLMQNNSEKLYSKHFLKIKLIGEDGNRFALGTSVTVYTKHGIQYQQEYNTRGFMSSSDYTMVFGLDSMQMIDSLKIIWPDRSLTKFTNIKADQTLRINKIKNSKINEELVNNHLQILKDLGPDLDIQYSHLENKHNDIGYERLIPHLLSTQGPKVAIGDINNDGLDDFYIGGASDQHRALYQQTQGGKFKSVNETFWKQENRYEDVDAIFFDADNDGDKDLYVVSGGNEFRGTRPELLDRLYINNGKGDFKKELNRLPKIYENGSCVKVCDYDQDGDLDLFIGNRVVAYEYGLSPNNYLLENGGNGVFTVNTKFHLQGMVTDACWADVNADKKMDLVIVGEWMPVTVLQNTGSKFKEMQVPNSSGWWNTIQEADFDQDGDIDFVAGNQGLNTNLRASTNEPITLYCKDFDKNGSLDPVLTYFRHGKEYTLVHKDELVNQLPMLKKRYLDYATFAGNTVSEIFDASDLKKAVVKKANILTSVYLENTNGTLNLKPLPIEAQFSTIESVLVDDIDKDGHLDIITGGNFYENQPLIGRFDASYGWIFLGDSKGNFKTIYPNVSGLVLRGQVRDLKQITLRRNRKVIIAARNNETMQIIETK